MFQVPGIIAVAAVCVLLLWLASRIEPHWPSKDGERFTCAARPVSPHGPPIGRWREVRCTLGPGRAVVVDRRGVVAPAPRSFGHWSLIGRDPEPPKGKVIYLLDSDTDDGRMQIRIPASSRCVAVLDNRLASEPTSPT